MNSNDAIPARVDLKEPEWKEISRILVRHADDCEAWAFGSRAGGRARDFSDLDLVLVGDAPLPLLRLAEIKDAFTESQLPFRVDVLDFHRLSEEFRRRIERDRVILRRPKSER